MSQKKNLTKLTLQLFWQHAWRYPKYIVGLLIFTPLTILLGQIVPPLILANVLNRLARGDFQPHQIWTNFGPELVIYAVLVLGSGVVLWRVVDALDWRLEGNVERDLARRIYDHLLNQSADFHANHFGGSLVSQTNKTMGAYIRVADTTVFSVLPLISVIVFSGIFLAKRAPLFDLILMVFSVFYIASAFFVTKRVRRLSAKQAAAESAQTGYLADSVTNVMAIKSFAGGAYERKQFAKITNHTLDRLVDLTNGHQRQQVYFTGLTNGISAVSLAMAVVGVMTFHANVATVFLILNYTATITNWLFVFSNNALRTYNRALGDAADMTEILQIEPAIKDPAHPEKPQIHAGAIELKDVTFTHKGSDDTLFDGLNLAIKPGEKIGLVGHSGSGKTTLTRILLRFSDIDSGEILIDGQNIAHLTQDDLRQNISYVAQEPLLFHRSIRENIAYGKQDASEAEIVHAAEQAHAIEFIDMLPAKYETLVGERGVKLSGGQRQRIAIARALLKDAPVLVLDEATSALDSESEVLIQDALWKLMESRTAIVIAHRLSTIQKMDRILVLENGEIIEQGTHKSLLAQKGTYAKLWAHQSGGFIED
ncbi:MAG TPA: ABC transporter ATP-binding protein [Candidatus Saccharimonadales bacterium]|nr:ABC transporter ATP-binding protein [Candidatus Saccharimonadales bacterium]